MTETHPHVDALTTPFSLVVGLLELSEQLHYNDQVLVVAFVTFEHLHEELGQTVTTAAGTQQLQLR